MVKNWENPGKQLKHGKQKILQIVGHKNKKTEKAEKKLMVTNLVKSSKIGGIG